MCRNCTHDAHPGEKCPRCGCDNHKNVRRRKKRTLMPPDGNPIEMGAATIEGIAGHLEQAAVGLRALAGHIRASQGFAPPPPVRTTLLATPAPPADARHTPRATQPRKAEPKMLTATSGSQPELSACEQAIVTVLRLRHPRTTSRDQLAVLSGYSAISGGISKAVGNLRAGSLMEGPGNAMRLTETGLRIPGPDVYPVGTDPIHWWQLKLKKASAACLRVLVDAYPHAVTRETLAEKTEYSSISGGISKAMAQLRRLRLADGWRASRALMGEE
jgi:hypothetical protein